MVQEQQSVNPPRQDRNKGYIFKTNVTGPLQPISLNGNIIKYVSSSKCLGIIVDTKLNWKSQINNVSSDLSSKLKKLRRIKSLPPSTLETIYFKGILPSALYGIAVWESCAPETLQNLENVHIPAARFIHKLHPSIPKTDVLQIVNWKLIGYMYKRRLACLTHQALYDKEQPADIQDIITIQSTTGNMRDNLKLVIHRPKIEYRRKTLKHRAAITWNTVPESLKRVENYSTFKQYLTRHSRTLDGITSSGSVMIKNKNIDSFFYY